MMRSGVALRHQMALMQEQHLVGDLLHQRACCVDNQQSIALGLQPAEQRHH